LNKFFSEKSKQVLEAVLSAADELSKNWTRYHLSHRKEKGKRMKGYLSHSGEVLEVTASAASRGKKREACVLDHGRERRNQRVNISPTSS